MEDDPGDVLLVEELLADSGMRASLTAVRSLAEASDLLNRGTTPGCVLLDLHLPDVQGLEAVTQMLAAAPGAPVVVLTGLAEESAGLAAVAAGAQDYLIKGQAPPDVFGRAIRYATQRKHVEQASAALQRSALRAEENARLERALLPTPLIRTGAFEMVARYRPGRANALLGGDFYDVVETSDGVVHAVIGDVCGHGARRGGYRGLPAGGLAVAGPGGRGPGGADEPARAVADGRARRRSPLRHPHSPGLRPGPAQRPGAAGGPSRAAAAHARARRARRGAGRARGGPGVRRVLAGG